MMEEPPVNSPAFDLSFEEITANIQRLQAQISHSVQAPDNGVHYLEDIQSVNDALSQGARIAIRVHHHSLTCLPGKALPSIPPPPGCLLILKKIVVTCARFAQSQLYSISLQFWDDTHEQSTIWSATTAQPQWETIVEQAAQFQATRPSAEE
jgi:hypothetical protein